MNRAIMERVVNNHSNVYDYLELPSVPETNNFNNNNDYYNNDADNNNNNNEFGDSVHPEESLELSQYTNLSSNTKNLIFKQGNKTFSYNIETGEKTWLVRMVQNGNVCKEFHSSGRSSIPTPS